MAGGGPGAGDGQEVAVGGAGPRSPRAVFLNLFSLSPPPKILILQVYSIPVRHYVHKERNCFYPLRTGSLPLGAAGGGWGDVQYYPCEFIVWGLIVNLKKFLYSSDM